MDLVVAYNTQTDARNKNRAVHTGSRSNREPKRVDGMHRGNALQYAGMWRQIYER